MVIGGLLAIEHFLTRLGSNLNLSNGTFKVILCILFLGVRELDPTSQLRTVHVGFVFLGRHQSHSFFPFETGFRDVSGPYHGISLLYSIVNHGHQVIKRKIIILFPQPVVRHLDGKALIVRMVSERCQGDIIIHVKTERSGIGLGSIGFTIHKKCLGNLSEVSVKNPVKTGLPCSRKTTVGAAGDSLQITFHSALKLAMYVVVLAIIQSGIGLLGNDTISLPHIWNIKSAATLREIAASIESYKAIGLILITLAHYVHLRQIDRFSTFTQDFILKKSIAREAPACAALILVFYRGRLNYADIGEYKSGCIFLLFWLVLSPCVQGNGAKNNK